MVNSRADVRASPARPLFAQRKRDRQARATLRRFDQPRRSALGVTHRAEYAAFELMEGLGCCEKTVAVRIAHNDTRLLRSDLDNVAIGQFTPALYSPCAL